jgi:osmoprotectant transport system substrate-binding protein
MLRIRTVALAAVAATSLILAGCGSSGNPLDTASETGSSEPAPTTAATTDADSAAASSDTTATDTSAAGGSTTETAQQPIVIGSANFTESELVAQIYAAALTAKGIDASTHLDIGAREVYLQAMEEGSVTLFPEYTGGLLAYYDAQSTAHSSEDVYAALQQALPADLRVLEYSPAQDQDSVTVTQETADKYQLESIGDLAPVAGEMTLGGSSEWQTRADGPQGMEKLYGVVFKDYKVLDPGGPLSVKGLQTGLVQATDIFTTDPAIEANGFVVLKDPKNLFLAQNIVPLIAASAATPAVTDTLNAVSAKLTTQGLTSMLKEISDTKADPAGVAQKWVADNGLG